MYYCISNNHRGILFKYPNNVVLGKVEAYKSCHTTKTIWNWNWAKQKPFLVRKSVTREYL